MAKYFSFKKCEGVKYRYDYEKICEDLNNLAYRKYGDSVKEIVREMSKIDMFFFAYFVLGLKFLNCKFGVERCYEVQDKYNYVIDLWARGHFKSTIKTFVLPLWRIINNPEDRQSIYSHTREQSTAFNVRIKTEAETNTFLIATFDDIFYANPVKESPLWTQQALIFKRKGNYNEASIEANGLIKGMPTGKHYTFSNYDDLVTEKVTMNYDTKRMLEERFGLSRNLVADVEEATISGTFYSFDDLYVKLSNNPLWRARIYPATNDGTADGEPVLWTKKKLEQKKREMGKYEFATQILLKPVPDEEIVFKPEWIRFYDRVPNTPMRVYLIVDPSGDRMYNKYKNADWCVMVVIGIDQFNNRYLLDMVRDKLSLTLRWETLKKLSLKWSPVVIGYERYGMQADIAYIDQKQAEEGIFLPRIVQLGGNIPKASRIRKLVPYFENGNFFLPKQLTYVDVNGNIRNLIEEFIAEEYSQFPKSMHDDMLDAMSRMTEDAPIQFTPPAIKAEIEKHNIVFDPLDIQKDYVGDWRAW